MLTIGNGDIAQRVDIAVQLYCVNPIALLARQTRLTGHDGGRTSIKVNACVGGAFASEGEEMLSLMSRITPADAS
jgi:hypothetical protein